MADHIWLGISEAARLAVERGFDPDDPWLGIPCQEDRHDACDEFGYIPWCQCHCHAPDDMTNVCYHGRHDLCPKQPAKEGGLPRCSCHCHVEVD